MIASFTLPTEDGRTAQKEAHDMGERYNGWKNYETWAVGLWIDNDHGLYDSRRDLAREVWDHSEDEKPDYLTRSEYARHTFAEVLKDWIQEMAPDLGATLFSDLMNAALSEVDWFELADSWLNEEINENAGGGYEAHERATVSGRATS